MNHPLEKYLGRVRRPSRYLGKELFSVVKEPDLVKLHFALAFPDLYEVGMSYLGMKILYHILNQLPEVWAERVFTPAPDMVQLLREQTLLLPSLESGRPLKEFDLIGFSLPYELGYTNVLNMLSLGGIPVWSRERNDGDPVVIAGGPCTFNPEPMSGFFDALVIGDGEEVIQEICSVFLNWKKTAADRQALLASLAELPGVYIPALYLKIKGGPDKNEVIQKRIIPDLNQAGYPAVSPLPFQQIIHDRLSVEIARGCTRGCRFCQAGVIYRPVRERSPEQVYTLIEEGLSHSGYAEATLLSLSSGDYTCLDQLLPALMERWERDKVALSLPSLRVDTLNSEVIEQIRRVRKTGFTIAPEAGTQRLRDVINKNVTEEEILQTAQAVFSLGWRVLKLYFMIGLPTETQEDLEGLVFLVKRIEKTVHKKGGRLDIHVALSPFIPKPHTPFQWASQLSMEESLARLNFIRGALNGKHIQVKWNDTRQSFLEGILSRGDQRLGPVIFNAFQKGAFLDAWGEHFSWEIWQKALEEEGVEPKILLQARSREHVFPWDFIQSGVDKDYLWSEYQKALTGRSTPDCRQGECQQCGVCQTFEVEPLIFDKFTIPSGGSFIVYPRESVKKFRLLLTKIGPSRFLGYLEWKEAIIRSFRRARLPLAYSQGFHPLPRLSFGQALPVGLSSLGEWIDVQISDWMNAGQIRKLLPKELFPGTEILDISEVPLNSHLPQNQACQYQVELGQREDLEEKIKGFLSSCEWLVEKPGKKTGPLNLRKLIRNLSQRSENSGNVIITWNLEPGMEGEIRPDLILKSVFNLSDTLIQGLNVIKSLAVESAERSP
ncbi:MAG: TIGR03960 family B12-binding radical SAM protein [Deltaproteobacteria bacterium]|nr:TIGR03960 family B12-binding radical SAM protein [Deltaproteobacteria bacterium]